MPLVNQLSMHHRAPQQSPAYQLGRGDIGDYVTYCHRSLDQTRSVLIDKRPSYACRLGDQLGRDDIGH